MLHIIEELLAFMHDANIHQRIAGDIFDKKVHVLIHMLEPHLRITLYNHRLLSA